MEKLDALDLDIKLNCFIEQSALFLVTKVSITILTCLIMLVENAEIQQKIYMKTISFSKGYKLIGPQTRHCNGTGHWDSENSLCVGKSFQEFIKVLFIWWTIPKFENDKF
jgi:hypothetical protein